MLRCIVQKTAVAAGVPHCENARPSHARRTYATARRGLNLLASVALALSLGGTTAAQGVYEMTPYRVELLVAFDSSPRITQPMREQLPGQIAERLETLVGATWTLTVGDVPAELQRTLVADIETLITPSPLPADASLDKRILLVVSFERDHYRVAGREFDVHTQTFGTHLLMPVWHAGKLRDVAVDVAIRCFAPLARIEKVQDGQVLLRVKGSGLPVRDPSLRWVRPGMVFRPMIRFNERTGKLLRVTPIPWTFCVVDDATSSDDVPPGLTATQLITGLRSPLSSRRRGRVEPLALAVAAPSQPSTLVLQANTQPHIPLGGYDIFAHPPDVKTTTWLGRTDLLGRITIAPSESPIRVLIVRSGNESLARLPVMPGLESELLARVSNDDARLQAEGIVTGLQEELVDLVTRREVLIARAETQLAENHLDKAAELVTELQRLPTRLQFQHRITQAQKRLTADDPLVQRKIDALFSHTAKMVDEYLKPEPIEQLWQTLRKTRTEGNQ